MKVKIKCGKHIGERERDAVGLRIDGCCCWDNGSKKKTHWLFRFS